MNEFLAFILSGVVERFESNFKQKVIYFLKIVYYSIAIIFAVGVVHEIAIYLQTDSIDYTVLGKVHDPLDKKDLIYNFLYSLALPIYVGYTLWYCHSEFDHKKISISLSLIISTIICAIAQPYNIFPKLAEYNLTVFLFLPVVAVAIYLIVSNIFSHNMIVKCKKIWENHRIIFTCIYVLLFILFMLYYSETELLNTVVVIISSTFLALMLIYVRRLLGLYYAIVLHYILASPVILATGYMLVNQL